MNTNPIMKTGLTGLIRERNWALLALLTFSLSHFLALASAAENKPAVPAKAPEPVKAEIVIPKSVFAENSPTGKDPFFPNSTRRHQTITRSETNSVAEPRPVVVQLSLKGISRSTSKPLALINNATFAAGETGDVRCGLQLVKVRCLEIRDQSAVVEILALNEIRELKLREGI